MLRTIIVDNSSFIPAQNGQLCGERGLPKYPSLYGIRWTETTFIDSNEMPDTESYTTWSVSEMSCIYNQGALLLTWINFDPGMVK